MSCEGADCGAVLNSVRGIYHGVFEGVKQELGGKRPNTAEICDFAGEGRLWGDVGW